MIPLPRPSRWVTGFSLIETVVALAVVAVLLVAMGSAVLLASRALPSAGADAQSRQAAKVVVDQLTDLLLEASVVTEKTDRSMAFTTADLDGDTLADTVRIAWSGAAGDPLTQEINGRAPVNLLDSVQDFTVLYTLRSKNPQATNPPAIEGTEQLLLQQDTSNSGDGSGEAISASASIAQFFQPVLPPDAVSWRVTRLTFMASTKNPKDGETVVEVQHPTGGAPGGGVVDAVTVLESNLPNNSWYEVQFPSAGGLSPADGCVIALRYGSGSGTVASAKTGVNSTGSPGTTFWKNSGSGWQEIAGQDMWLWVWGKAATPDPNWTPPPAKFFLRNVILRLQPEANVATTVESEAQVLNEPEVTGL